MSSTKTQNSHRTIDISEKIYDQLLIRYNYLKTTSNFTDEFFIFGDKTYTSISTLRKHFNLAVEKANVKKITFHGLRHSLASLLLSNSQIPENLIAERMGHTVEMLRKTYSHVYKKSRKEMIKYINNL